jgi:hypothetical protein
MAHSKRPLNHALTADEEMGTFLRAPGLVSSRHRFGPAAPDPRSVDQRTYGRGAGWSGNVGSCLRGLAYDGRMRFHATRSVLWPRPLPLWVPAAPDLLSAYRNSVGQCLASTAQLGHESSKRSGAQESSGICRTQW